jgi:hypothetical protein
MKAATTMAASVARISSVDVGKAPTFVGMTLADFAEIFSATAEDTTLAAGESSSTATALSTALSASSVPLVPFYATTTP